MVSTYVDGEWWDKLPNTEFVLCCVEERIKIRITYFSAASSPKEFGLDVSLKWVVGLPLNIILPWESSNRSTSIFQVKQPAWDCFGYCWKWQYGISGKRDLIGSMDH